MRKFYLSLLALVSTIAFTASANGWEKSQSVVMPKAYEAAIGSAQTKLLKKSAKKAVVSRAGEEFKLEDYEGSYSWQYIDLFSGNAVADDVTISIADASANTLEIDGLFGGAVLIGKVDLSNGSISIAPIEVGYNEQFQEDLVFMCCDNIGTETEPEFVPLDGDLVLSYVNDPEEGEMYITESFYCVVGRNAAGTLTYTDGYYALAQYGVVVPIVPWIDCGEATFYDGSGFLPLFVDAPAPVVLSLQKSPNEGEEGVYRLVGPWNSAFGGELNNLTFIVTNPNCVVIPQQATGIAEKTLGAAYVESASYDYLAAGYTVEQFLADAPQRNIVLDGNRIDLPIGSFFTIFENSQSIYYISEEKGGTAGYIILPENFGDSVGVEGIVVEDANAPAEFFNLQGQRVAEPVKGNLYIKRQGVATSKVVF